MLPYLDKEKSLLFNPDYHLRQDGNRVILFSDEEVSEKSEEWFSFIHPFHAMMFSFFDGRKSYVEEVRLCAEFFKISFSKMEDVVRHFSNKPHWFTIKSQTDFINFPKNILLEIEKSSISRKDQPMPTDFRYMGHPDYKTVKLKYPISINMELTMKCYANCVYCYANRKLKSKEMLTLSEIQDVIRQAKENGVYTIDVNGGDVLLHPNIKEILKCLVDNGYRPLVSTKMILKKDFIDYLKSLKSVRLQISLDSVDVDVLNKLIGVPPDYIDGMSKTLSYLSEFGFRTQINVVLTKYNSDRTSIKALLDYLAKYDAVKEVRFNPCGYSLYKKDFNDLILSAKKMQSILEEIESMKDNYVGFSVKVSSFDDKSDYVNDKRKDLFNSRSLCTGGTRSAVLLPNGDITICEELYDNPKFVLGNIRNTPLGEVWNSPQAMSLYKTPIKANSVSPCKACLSQSECRSGVGICWKMVLMAYGDKNWDYPDPRCPHAPHPFNTFYYE